MDSDVEFDPRMSEYLEAIIPKDDSMSYIPTEYMNYNLDLEQENLEEDEKFIPKTSVESKRFDQ